MRDFYVDFDYSTVEIILRTYNTYFQLDNKGMYKWKRMNIFKWVHVLTNVDGK